MITVYKASNITEAQIVKGLLEASNIDAFVKGFYLQGGIGETSPADFAAVTVEEDQVDSALEIIAAYEKNESGSNTLVSDNNSKTTGTYKINKNLIIIPIVIIAFFIATLLSAQ